MSVRAQVSFAAATNKVNASGLMCWSVMDCKHHLACIIWLAPFGLRQPYNLIWHALSDMLC